MSNEAKRKHLEQRINEFVKTALDTADRCDKLDFIVIEISNHHGNLQMDHTIRDRVEAYKEKKN